MKEFFKNFGTVTALVTEIGELNKKKRSVACDIAFITEKELKRKSKKRNN